MNFVDGGAESEGLIFTGSEGTMEIAGNSVSVNRVPRETEPGLTIGYLSAGDAESHRGGVSREVSAGDPIGTTAGGIREVCCAPEGYSDSYDHFANFFASVGSRKPVVEDAVFGFRAAGAALLSNLSMERGTIAHWDPEEMKLV